MINISFHEALKIYLLTVNSNMHSLYFVENNASEYSSFIFGTILIEILNKDSFIIHESLTAQLKLKVHGINGLHVQILA